VAANSNEALRALPSVEALASELDGPRELAVGAAREAIASRRAELVAGADANDGAPLADAARARLAELRRGSLRSVVNATGVILHTNLGRAPLAREAAEAAAAVATGYSNLEYDLGAGERGSRHAHVEPDLRALAGAEAAIAVNNNAAAVLLALAATAAGGEVIVGRDQLIEIGGSFRIPEILAQSGAELVEVGTTNRTRIADYERAIGPRTRALLRVHQSNFRTEGFTESPPLAGLAALGSAHGLATIDDLGSGALAPIGDEPLLRESVAAGADLVCCSADKLLGGPQAGIIAGRAAAVERCRSHPLARALRLDKLQIGALAATLRMHREGRAGEIPAPAMLAADGAELGRRAERLASGIGPAAAVGSSESRPGGGTLPATVLPGPACFVDPGATGADTVAAALRAWDPPVIARIADGRLVLDPRTIAAGEVEVVIAATRAALD
jgi:L-seryl-tRNA(Ser) seleniumtransferase